MAARKICAWVLGLAMSQASAAPPATEVFLLPAEGSITVGADGSVIDVELDDQTVLGKDAAKGYEQHIRSWRFEPVLENGVPVNAKCRMNLQLVAVRDKGANKATFGIRRVTFVDPPRLAATAGIARPTLAAPRYPDAPMREGIGAQLDLLVQLDADGHVTNVATERLLLLGRTPGNQAGKYSANFRRVAERVAAGWTIPGFSDGQLVIVPVNFNPSRGASWLQIHPGTVEIPAWVAVARTQRAAVDLVASGDLASTRFHLLTPLTDADGG